MIKFSLRKKIKYLEHEMCNVHGGLWFGYLRHLSLASGDNLEQKVIIIIALEVKTQTNFVAQNNI